MGLLWVRHADPPAPPSFSLYSPRPIRPCDTGRHGIRETQSLDLPEDKNNSIIFCPLSLWQIGRISKEIETERKIGENELKESKEQRGTEIKSSRPEFIDFLSFLTSFTFPFPFTGFEVRAGAVHWELWHKKLKFYLLPLFTKFSVPGIEMPWSPLAFILCNQRNKK